MKQILVIMAAVVLVGCSNDTRKALPIPTPQAPEGEPNIPETSQTVEAEEQVVNELSAEFLKTKAMAESGDSAAQSKLSMMYANMRPPNRDQILNNINESIKWMRKAAEGGDIEAQYSLAGLLRSGAGVKKDLEESTKWYRIAAEQGDARAQNNLGFAYLYGEGVLKKNLKESFKWFKKSADQGHPEGKANMGAFLKEYPEILKD